MKYCAVYKFPAGTLYLAEENGAVTDVTVTRPVNATDGDTELLRSLALQLDEYFAGTRKSFDVPLAPQGTVFRKRVWEELRAIPYGETRTYGDIARAIGNANASRAVGQANRNNPLWILSPCHRVIGADGGLTGYAGGVEMKKYLLELEKTHG